MGRLGAHVSISGGVARSVERALDLKLESFQIFTRNQRQWDPAPLRKEDVAEFKAALSNTDLGPVLVHSSYLINPAAGEERVSSRSLNALKDEMARCSYLGLERLVLHPGSHKGEGVTTGIKRIAMMINRAHSEMKGSGPRVLLETTAGQGTGIGSSFQELGDIIDLVDREFRPGICMDTCHMHAAGIDLSSDYLGVMDDLEEILGSDIVLGIHLNDSIKELGSRVDRHTNIGSGTIGIEAFENLVNDKRFEKVPMILETPGGDEAFRKDLSILESMRE